VYGTERKASHLIYMDDFKLIEIWKKELRTEIKIV
jgi:hypothetical protein